MDSYVSDSTEDDAIRFTRHKTGTLKPTTGPAQQKKKKMFEIKVRSLFYSTNFGKRLKDLRLKGGQNAFSLKKSTGAGVPSESFGERLTKASANGGQGSMSRGGKFGNVSMTYDSSSQRGKKQTRGAPRRQ